MPTVCLWRSRGLGRNQRPKTVGQPADRPSFFPRWLRIQLREPSSTRSSMARVGLTLITGPANAGKVALLLQRYLDALPREPVLIVPNRSDVDQVERELLRLQPALLGGTIGTFDDLFARIARAPRGSVPQPVVSGVQRALLVRRAVERSRSLLERSALGRSGRFGGFAEALLASIGELESGMLDPSDLDGELGV